MITRYKRRPPKRHPAEVTADRLGDHIERYYDKLSGAERDAISRIRDLLYDIADGAR